MKTHILPSAWFALLIAALPWACATCSPSKDSRTTRKCNLNSSGHKALRVVEDPIAEVRDDRHIDTRVHLPLRNSDELDELLRGLYTSSDPRYLKFITPSEFAARFHPSSTDIHKAQAHFAAHGLSAQGPAHGSVLKVSGKTGAFSKALGVTLHHHLGANDSMPRVVHGVPGHKDLPDIRAVPGLGSPPRRIMHLNRAARESTNYARHISDGLDAATLRRAYRVPDSLLATDQTIAFVELDGYLESDIDAYARTNNIRRVPTRVMKVAGFDGKVHNPESQVEVTMDLQVAMAMAPSAAEFRVFEAPNSHFIDVFNELANPTIGDKKLMRIISCSWGAPESEMSEADILAENDIFRQLAAQGQVVFSASGDNGARDDGHSIGVDDPGAQPWITAVGGTSLFLDPAGNIRNETAWSGSGGGHSACWEAPWWQIVSVPSQAKVRSVPDISAHADPSGPSGTYKCIVNGQLINVGGTSCAAPLWAGVAALVEQQRKHSNRPPLGAWVPHIYRVGATSDNAHVFNDIIRGDNKGFEAVAGYDNVTGFGSMKTEAFVSLFGSL